MKIIIQTPDFKPQDSLREFVGTHVSKLKSLSNRIHECRVFLKLDKSDTKENKICEIKLGIPGNDLFAFRQSNTFEDAVLQTIGAIKHQVERWKASTNRRYRGSITPLESEEGTM